MLNSELTKETAENIFTEYSDFVFRTALYLSGSRALADDITQETFIRIFHKYHLYNRQKPIQPWIYRITVNITRNLLRKHKWLVFFESTPERICEDFPEKIFIMNEEKRELWQEINHLSLKSKEIVFLHFYMDMKLKEISNFLGIPLGTCKSRLNFALNSLRARFSSGNSWIKNSRIPAPISGGFQFQTSDGVESPSKSP